MECSQPERAACMDSQKLSSGRRQNLCVHAGLCGCLPAICSLGILAPTRSNCRQHFRAFNSNQAACHHFDFTFKILWYRETITWRGKRKEHPEKPSGQSTKIGQFEGKMNFYGGAFEDWGLSMRTCWGSVFHSCTQLGRCSYKGHEG